MESFLSYVIVITVGLTLTEVTLTQVKGGVIQTANGTTSGVVDPIEDDASRSRDDTPMTSADDGVLSVTSDDDVVETFRNEDAPSSPFPVRIVDGFGSGFGFGSGSAEKEDNGTETPKRKPTSIRMTSRIEPETDGNDSRQIESNHVTIPAADDFLRTGSDVTTADDHVDETESGQEQEEENRELRKMGDNRENPKTEAILESENSSAVVTSQYDVRVLNEEVYIRYSAIVEALEALGILDPDGKWCYSIRAITKSSSFFSLTDPHSPPSFKVEMLIGSRPLTPTPQSLPVRPSTRVRSGSGRKSSSEPRGSDVTRANSTSGVGCNVSGSDCVAMANDNDPENETGSIIRNGSGLNPRMERKLISNHQVENGSPLRPSRTQILVISTCSTVIGVFFIIALIMRIRNHLKRTRSLSKHRNGGGGGSGGVKQHRPTTATSGPRDPSTTATAVTSLPPSNETPPADTSHVENDGDALKSDDSVKDGRPPGSFFSRRLRWCSGGSGRRRHSTHPKPPSFRRQSELTRLFVSQRSQREAAREYIRQLSLTSPVNAFLVGELTPSDETTADKSPNNPLQKLFYRPTENFQKLDIV